MTMRALIGEMRFDESQLTDTYGLFYIAMILMVILLTAWGLWGVKKKEY